LRRDDDYVAAGKPACDWEDELAREALVDALARDVNAAILFLDGRELSAEVQAAAKLLATVVGQDLEQTEDGTFRILRGVAPDRVVSTVDPETRHGHKTAARGFDGYKGHIAIDPDSEIITAAEVTAGNAGDASAAMTLLTEVLPNDPVSHPSSESATPEVEVFGDAAYATASFLSGLMRHVPHEASMHDFDEWAKHQHSPPRATALRRTKAPEEPRLEAELQSHAAQGRTEARAYDASPARWAPCSRSRSPARDSRFFAPGGRHQLRASREARRRVQFGRGHSMKLRRSIAPILGSAFQPHRA